MAGDGETEPDVIDERFPELATPEQRRLAVSLERERFLLSINQAPASPLAEVIAAVLAKLDSVRRDTAKDVEGGVVVLMPVRHGAVLERRKARAKRANRRAARLRA